MALLGGAILGIFCVVGAYLRSGSSASPTFIFALWFNRVIIGLAIGAPWPAAARNKALLRGAVLGLLVSFAFYSSTGFVDPVSFIAGMVYGVILEAWLSSIEKHYPRPCGQSTRCWISAKKFSASSTRALRSTRCLRTASRRSASRQH